MTCRRGMSWKTFKFFDKEVLKDPETKQPYQDLAVRTDVVAAQGAPLRAAPWLGCWDKLLCGASCGADWLDRR